LVTGDNIGSEDADMRVMEFFRRGPAGQQGPDGDAVSKSKTELTESHASWGSCEGSESTTRFSPKTAQDRRVFITPSP
jgi:hypothetical protein